MSNVVRISGDDDALELATRWILKLDEGEFGLEDEAAMQQWLDEDQRHREVLLEVALNWDKTDALSRLADIFPHENPKNSNAGLDASSNVFWSPGAAIAACLLVMVCVGGFYTSVYIADKNNSFAHQLQKGDYQTRIGERKTVLLPDGSEMVLNTNSQVNVVFNEDARVVYLERGEIHVSVAKDTRPLSVVANDQIVQATGTEFTVEITEEKHVEVIVTEGSVVVGLRPKNSMTARTTQSYDKHFQTPPILSASNNNTVSAGEELLLAESKAVRSKVSTEDIKVKLSWKEGSLVFRSQPLEKVLQQVGRYTHVEFVVVDEHLNSISLTGRFQTGDVETLLELLEANFNIRHDFESERRVLLSALN